MAGQKRRRGVERRRRIRTDARLSMRVEGVPDNGQPAQIVTETRNISASGVYCHASHFLAPLSKVALTIVLPPLPGARATNELLKCEAIVVRCDPTGQTRGERRFQLACMFTELSPRHRERLETFVTWRNLEALRAAAAGVRARARPPARRPAAKVPARRGTPASSPRPRAARSSRPH